MHTPSDQLDGALGRADSPSPSTYVRESQLKPAPSSLMRGTCEAPSHLMRGTCEAPIATSCEVHRPRMSRCTGPHAMRDARPEGSPRATAAGAVRCRPVAHAVAVGVAGHFLFFGCFSFETFKNQTKSVRKCGHSRTITSHGHPPHATRPGHHTVKKLLLDSLNNSASRSR